MSSIWGNNIKVSIFGESHGVSLGVVIDGLPSGEKIDMDEILFHMSRRAPGKDKSATPRRESDTPEIQSGFLNGYTTGTPLCAIIRNTNTKSGDYNNILTNPRPGHADFTGNARYNGFNDISGGGHFSGRLTAALTFAGSVCRQILKRRGITIGSHISSIGDICDEPFNSVNLDTDTLENLAKDLFALNDKSKQQAMREAIDAAMADNDSIGGTVETAIIGLSAGVGSPMFYGIENVLSSAVFAVPAVKGIEFGAAFEVAKMRGSQANDNFMIEKGKVVTKTNNCGGILGGISNGMPIIFKSAIKPTPSISAAQDTVNLETMENTTIEIHGRHDPCIVPRALPAIESVAAIAVINLLAEVNKL